MKLSNDELPGYKAQKLLTPPFRAHSEGHATSKKAGVMLILQYDQDGKLTLLFIERAAHEQDNHSGQISFPGGQYDPSTDEDDLMKTALREVREEIGLHIDENDIVGKLTNLYVPVSDFIIYPYVAVLDSNSYELQLQESEVESVLTERLDTFMTKDAIHYKTITVRNFTLENVPYYNLKGHTLWGATAMITTELLAILKEG